jgi:DNA-binding beta-propeller fold protein YncE
MRKSLVGLFAAGVLAMAAPVGYHVIKEIKIGGEGGWDYLTIDSAAGRLYVSHATKVEVVDVGSGKVVGEIPETPGVHGIAIAPKLGRGFVSNGRGNSVTIFDLKTLKAIGQVKTGENPDAIQFEPVSGRVFTFNGRSKNSTAFDAVTGKVAGTIELGGKPEFSAADGKGKVYANIEDTSEIVEVDAQKLSVTKRYSLKPCESPSGLAMDTAKRRLFSACDNKLMAISDPDKGSVISTAPIGEEPDGAGFDQGRGLAFTSNGDGTITVVRDTTGFPVAETVKTEAGARTMTVDQKTHKLYLSVAQRGTAPQPTAATPRPRPAIVPGTFKILVVGE